MRGRTAENCFAHEAHARYDCGCAVMKRGAKQADQMPSFFPSRTPRTRGGPKKPIAFRSTEPLTGYVEAIVKRGYSMTEVMMFLGLIAKDVLSGMEPARLLVEHEAEKRNMPVGVAIASLAVERLEELYPEFFKRPAKK